MPQLSENPPPSWFWFSVLLVVLGSALIWMPGTRYWAIIEYFIGGEPRDVALVLWIGAILVAGIIIFIQGRLKHRSGAQALSHDLLLLDGEIVKKTLKPHPLAFMHLYWFCIFLLVWGAVMLWLPNSEYWTPLQDFVGGDTAGVVAIIVWLLGLVIAGFVGSLLLIVKRPLFVFAGIGIAGTALMLYYALPYDTFIGWYTIGVSLPGFLLVNQYRNSHRYYITSFRLVLMKKFISKDMRELRYNKINDVAITQNVLGRVFNFGSITPITASGFGLGSDASTAGVAAGADVQKKGRLGVFAGGSKEVQGPRARSYYELYGIHNPMPIRHLISSLIEEYTDIHYLRQNNKSLDEIKTLLQEQAEQKTEHVTKKTRTNH